MLPTVNDDVQKEPADGFALRAFAGLPNTCIFVSLRADRCIYWGFKVASSSTFDEIHGSGEAALLES
jgi:hypothetical protein